MGALLATCCHQKREDANIELNVEEPVFMVGMGAEALKDALVHSAKEVKVTNNDPDHEVIVLLKSDDYTLVNVKVGGNLDGANLGAAGNVERAERSKTAPLTKHIIGPGPGSFTKVPFHGGQNINYISIGYVIKSDGSKTYEMITNNDCLDTNAGRKYAFTVKPYIPGRQYLPYEVDTPMSTNSKPQMSTSDMLDKSVVDEPASGNA